MRHLLQSSDDSILRGVQVVEVGEAEGHDFSITKDFLSAVVEQGNAAGSVKVRVNHPEGRGDVLSIVGEASNFRLDGDCVRADVHLFDVPDKSRLMALAQQAGHLFGMSLDFAGETIKKAGSKLKTMTCEAIYAVDFVDTPAATRALFSAGTEKGHWRAVCRLTSVKVDEKQQTEAMETNMTKQTLSKLAKKFGIDADAKDFEAQLATKLAEPDGDEGHPEPDGDEGYEKIMSALSGIEARLTKLEKGGEGDEKEEKLADEKPVEDEEKEEAMATMAAKVCSIMLAKVGVKPRGSKPAADGAADGEVQLSVDEVKLAKSLGMDEKEQKQLAANLARAKQVKF